MKAELSKSMRVGLLGVLGLAAVGPGGWYAWGGEPGPAKPALPAIDKDEDEFYARVDEVVSATELLVTVLDVWQPLDKVRGARWPAGQAKVQPTHRTIVLEEVAVPNRPLPQKAAMDFIRKTLKASDNEIICTGSRVAVVKRPGGDRICVTGYAYVKEGFTLNNALVRQGLATTTNPFFKADEQKARQKQLGIWAEPK